MRCKVYGSDFFPRNYFFYISSHSKQIKIRKKKKKKHQDYESGWLACSRIKNGNAYAKMKILMWEKFLN